jgi:hypothetical protein
MGKRTKTGGRTKGTPNKATVLNREFVQILLNQQGDKIEQELSRLGGKEYINVVLQLMAFVVPKIERHQVILNAESQHKPKTPRITEVYDKDTDCCSFIVSLED